MKNRTGFYKKGYHPSNNLNLKSILSIFTMGIFIFFGFASIDEGDPTTRILNDCEFLHPPVAIAQKFTFYANDEMGKPFVGLYINFYIKEYEKVDDNSQCTLVLKNSYTKTLGFNSGTASFTLSKSYVSDDDEIDIYFKASLPGYDEYPFSFYVTKSSVPDLHWTIYLHKIEQNP